MPGSVINARAKRDALPLPTRQREPALADHGVVPVGKRHDEVVGLGRARGGLDVGVGRIRLPVRDVVAHALGEQEAVLEHDADLRSQRLERHVAHVDAVDAHGTGGDVVEARDEQRDRRLPRSRRADDRDTLARLDRELEALEHRLRPQVPEADAAELHPAPHRRQRLGIGLLGDERVGVEHVEHALGAGAGLLALRDEPRHHAHRRGQLHQVGEEGEERAQAQVAVDRHPTAEPDDRGLREGRESPGASAGSAPATAPPASGCGTGHDHAR